MPFTHTLRNATFGGALLTVSLLLTACGGGTPATPSAAPTSAAPSASASATTTRTPEPTVRPSTPAPLTSLDGITVSDDFGKAPTITFKSPFLIDSTRSKVIKAGSGPAIAADSMVSVNYAGYNTYTAKKFDSSWDRGQPAQFSLQQVVAGFKTGLAGKHVGDRVLVVMPGKDGYDASNGNPDAGILKGDSLLFVIDILDTEYTKPYGTPVTVPATLPRVSTDADGVPSLTIDTTAKVPATTVVQPIVDGLGSYKVAPGDQIAVKWRMYSWQTGKLLVDQYKEPDGGLLANTLPCWKDSLVGKRLGSRLMLVCPPASGYPNGNPTPAVTKGDTVVFLIDLLFAGPGQ